MAPPAARKALLNAAGCQERSADTSPARALSTNRFLKKQNQRHSLSAGLRAMHCPAPSAPSPLDFSKSNDEEKPSCQVGVIWFQFGFGAQQLSPTPHWSARCYSARGVSRRESLALNGGRTPRRGDGSREQRAEGWGLGSGLPHCPPCPSTAAHVPSDPNGECQCWAPPVVPGRSSQQGLKFRGFGQPPPPQTKVQGRAESMHSAEGQQEDGKHILSSGSSTEGGEEQQPGGTHHQTHCSPCVLRKGKQCSLLSQHPTASC